MKIVIYGGSFNPPHCGHVEAVRAVAEALKPDKLLIIPASIPPHKEMAANSASAQERLILSQLAFEDVPNAEVCDIELHRQGKSYSSDTLKQLMEIYPQAEFSFAMGTDMLLSFEEWHEFRFLLDNMTLAVFCRNEGENGDIGKHAEYLRREYGARIVYINHEPVPMSSTEIRAMLPLRDGADMRRQCSYSTIEK